MDKMEVKVDGETKTLTILQGDALPQKEPLKVMVVGNIDSIVRYLEKRKDIISINQSHIIVDIEEMAMSLVVNEKDHYQDKINAALKFSEAFKAFEINSGKERTTFQLADFIKMNRSFFLTPSDAAKLVTELNNFKAKVAKDIEKSDDKRANTIELKRQVVDSNIPHSFTINIPIFNGMPKRNIEVEVYINADTLNCSLISPHAQEIIQTETEDIINDQVKQIKELCPELVIINQ